MKQLLPSLWLRPFTIVLLGFCCNQHFSIFQWRGYFFWHFFFWGAFFFGASGLLASGFWLLASGCRFWLLASGSFGFWLLACISFWSQNLRFACYLLQFGANLHAHLAFGFWLLAPSVSGFWLVFAAFWSQNL